MTVKSGYKSGSQLITDLKAGGPPYIGMVKEGEDDQKNIFLSKGTDCSHWILVPLEQIDNIELIKMVACDDHIHPLVRIRFKAPKTTEAELFSSLAALHSNSSPLNSILGGADTGCYRDEKTGEIKCPPFV